MRQRVPVAPFHRRVLPWIFIIAFMAIAPAVIFYTAGYRWDTKKGQVERNGTVILDSVPSGAAIRIDGRMYNGKTPLTIQDMPPGLHHFEVSKSGFHTWSKALAVYSERVTFANTIHLWMDAQPTLVSRGNFRTISASPDQRTLIEITNATSNQILIVDSRTMRTSSFQLQLPMSESRPLISWSKNGRYAFVDSTMSDATPWVIDVQSRSKPVQLPEGMYRWEENALIGQTKEAQYTISLPDFGIRRVPHGEGIIDISETATLRTASGTSQIIYVSRSDPSHGLILPPGNWSFWSTDTKTILMRDGATWLSLQPSTNPPEEHGISGDLPRTVTVNGQPQHLIVNQTELWIWDLITDPVLAYRQSEPIVNAVWHNLGGDIFFASKTAMYALNLDPRDGKLMTQLATFDEITDFTSVGKTLYIAGTKNDQTGLWSLAIE